MQRQAVPLLRPQKPIVGTGIENQIAFDSGMVVLSHSDGMVKFVSANKISIITDSGEEIVYSLEKFQRSNQRNNAVSRSQLVGWVERVYS